jgi:hypothetical protein
MNKVTPDDRIVGGLALLLVICLLFLPWFDISVTVFGVTVGGTLHATDAPDGWTGVIAMLAALAVIVDLAVERFSSQSFPVIGGSREHTRFVLAAIAAGFIALKFLLHIHFSLFGWGFYVTVIVAAALVFAAARVNQGRPILPARPAGRPQ